MGQSEHREELIAESPAAETGVYRRADVEGFAEWARTTIAHLQAELVESQRRAASAEQRASDAERALADREGLETILLGAAERAADAAAQAAVDRVEALLEEAKEPRRDEQRRPAPAGRADVTGIRSDEGKDPLLDPLPMWDDNLRAFPDEPSGLPPIGSIFEDDTHRSA